MHLYQMSSRKNDVVVRDLCLNIGASQQFLLMSFFFISIVYNLCFYSNPSHSSKLFHLLYFFLLSYSLKQEETMTTTSFIMIKNK